MDVNRIVAELRGELAQMNEAIMALERIVYSHKGATGPAAGMAQSSKGV
jgi:hypothetical protein